jgi:hypothetical protein
VYKCEYCRAQKDIGDDVYFIESSFMNTFLPTCSKECAEKIKQREIKELQDRIDKLKNSRISKERW